MNEAMIREDSGVMTLINVFTVAPQHEQELVELLTYAADNLMPRQPGFVSASIHRSADERRVVNYAQWRSREDFEVLQTNPEVQSHFARIGAIAQFEPIVCEVAHVSAAWAPERA
jgi:heme-degrading monooxygenase HmoA